MTELPSYVMHQLYTCVFCSNCAAEAKVDQANVSKVDQAIIGIFFSDKSSERLSQNAMLSSSCSLIQSS